MKACVHTSLFTCIDSVHRPISVRDQIPDRCPSFSSHRMHFLCFFSENSFFVLTFLGRGVLQLFLPLRVPTFTMIGDPIECQRIENPTEDDIAKVPFVVYRNSLLFLLVQSSHVEDMMMFHFSYYPGFPSRSPRPCRLLALSIQI